MNSSKAHMFVSEQRYTIKNSEAWLMACGGATLLHLSLVVTRNTTEFKNPFTVMAKNSTNSVCVQKQACFPEQQNREPLICVVMQV